MSNKNKVKKLVATSLFFILGIIVTIFVIMLLSIVTDYGITIASFGASVLMIFSRKKLQNRKIFGAYFLSFLVGCIISILPTMTSFNLAVASLLSLVAMTIFDLQHAPAIGLAISMVLNKFSFWIDVVVALCIFIVIGMAFLLRSYLKDPDAFLSYLNIESEKIKWNL